METDRDVYGGHHPILVPSTQAVEMAATYHYCTSRQIPLPVTVKGWLYSKGEQSLTIASQVFCHLSSQEKESIGEMLLIYGVSPSCEKRRRNLSLIDITEFRYCSGVYISGD